MKLSFNLNSYEITGRTPSGVRGLKCEHGAVFMKSEESHPVRGAWIEIMYKKGRRDGLVVAPRQGCVD